MITLKHTGRMAAAAAGIALLAGCSQVGSLGNILGSVLGNGGNQLSGTVQNVDTRNQQFTLQESGGQNVALQYDANTRVVYQNRAYSVTSLDPGDQVSAYIQQLQNGGYYADSVVVVQPASGTNTNTSGSVQSLQGNVRTIDRTNGMFSMDVGNGTVLTVTLPYNTSSTDVNKFNAMRTGDYVRLYGVYVTTTRVELRNFY